MSEKELNDAKLTLATLCDMVLGEDANDRDDDALVRAVGVMKRERDAAQQSRARMIDALRACKIALDEAARIGDSEWKVYAGFKTAKTLIDEVLGV